MKKISIIVPVYKVEKYLARALDSLVNQTLDNVEIICVNDASPDGSLEILKKYQSKYPSKIVVIDKKINEGVWKARIDGINIAKGEYIGFCDSDDYISIEYAEKMYNFAKQTEADIVVCGFYRINSLTEKIYSKEMKFDSSYEIDMYNNPEGILSINGALWNKIFKASLLKNLPKLENPPSILEDMMFFLLICLNAKKIRFFSDYLYYYMVRSDSAITTIKKEQIEVTQNAMLNIKEIYTYNEKNDDIMELISDIAFLHFGISLMFRLSYDKNINLKKEIKNNEEFLNKNFSLWRKSRYLNISYCIANGFKNIKIAIMKKIYIFKLFPLFLKVYKFIIDKLNIDIKW